MNEKGVAIALLAVPETQMRNDENKMTLNTTTAIRLVLDKASNADDEAGKIDLLSCDGKIMRILELKKPDSKETMLRCVLEGYTYLKTVNSDKLITDFGYNPKATLIKASPFVFYGGEQHKEMDQFRPRLRKLMKLLDSKPYYIKGN